MGNQGTLTSPMFVRAARMKAGRESGQRRRSSRTPSCNGEDMVKVLKAKGVSREKKWMYWRRQMTGRVIEPCSPA